MGGDPLRFGMQLVQFPNGLFLPAGTVTPAVNEGVTVTGEDRPSSAAAARPGEPDAPDDVAVKISTRLLDTYAANPDVMGDHAA
jgi:hypothetical protein